VNQLAISFADRVKFARRLGTEAGEAAAAKDPTFEPRALDFLRAFVRSMPAGSAIPGEELTRAMKAAGILPPKDDRAFGPVFRKAENTLHILRIVGSVPRVRGHGSAGGKLYAAGTSVNKTQK
jgi:hypothetical protein